MIAIIYNSQGRVTGVYPDYDDSVELHQNFVVVDELPEEIVNLPDGHYLEYDGEFFVAVPYPATPEYANPLAEQVEDLKAKLTLMQEALDDLILGGGI